MKQAAIALPQQDFDVRPGLHVDRPEYTLVIFAICRRKLRRGDAVGGMGGEILGRTARARRRCHHAGGHCNDDSVG